LKEAPAMVASTNIRTNQFLMQQVQSITASCPKSDAANIPGNTPDYRHRLRNAKGYCQLLIRKDINE
jgi:hypothetical protein